MALETNITINGEIYDSAYLRINAVMVNYEQNLASGSVSLHRGKGLPKIAIVHNFDNVKVNDSSDARDDIYSYLKEHVFTESVDVYE